jgi:peptidoglycan glycosyltransferase
VLNALRGGLLHRSIRWERIETTLDAELQLEAHRLLRGRPGAVICLQPTSGEILAWVSSPSYDPARIGGDFLAAQRGRRDAPLVDRVGTGLYPPGSVFKLVVAAEALESGLEPTIACPAEGVFVPETGRSIRDHEYYEAERAGRRFRGHGTIGLERAIEVSSNTYFAQLGSILGGQGLLDAAQRFKLDQPPTIIPSRAFRQAFPCKQGSVPALNEISASSVAGLAIGQDRLLLTPLHMALVACTIAGGGMLPQPTFLTDAVAPGEPVLGAENALRLGEMMAKAVATGTGKRAAVSGVVVCGKTGTAERDGGPPHAWFVGYAPRERPEIALAVVVEGGGMGGAAAAPIAGKLFARYLAGGEETR